MWSGVPDDNHSGSLPFSDEGSSLGDDDDGNAMAKFHFSAAFDNSGLPSKSDQASISENHRSTFTRSTSTDESDISSFFEDFAPLAGGEDAGAAKFDFSTNFENNIFPSSGSGSAPNGFGATFSNDKATATNSNHSNNNSYDPLELSRTFDFLNDTQQQQQQHRTTPSTPSSEGPQRVSAAPLLAAFGADKSPVPPTRSRSNNMNFASPSSTSTRGSSQKLSKGPKSPGLPLDPSSPLPHHMSSPTSSAASSTKLSNSSSRRGRRASAANDEGAMDQAAAAAASATTPKKKSSSRARSRSKSRRSSISNKPHKTNSGSTNGERHRRRSSNHGLDDPSESNNGEEDQPLSPTTKSGSRRRSSSHHRRSVHHRHSSSSHTQRNSSGGVEKTHSNSSNKSRDDSIPTGSTRRPTLPRGNSFSERRARRSLQSGGGDGNGHGNKKEEEEAAAPPTSREATTGREDRRGRRSRDDGGEDRDRRRTRSSSRGKRRSHSESRRSSLYARNHRDRNSTSDRIPRHSSASGDQILSPVAPTRRSHRMSRMSSGNNAGATNSNSGGVQQLAAAAAEAISQLQSEEMSPVPVTPVSRPRPSLRDKRHASKSARKMAALVDSPHSLEGDNGKNTNVSMRALARASRRHLTDSPDAAASNFRVGTQMSSRLLVGGDPAERAFGETISPTSGGQTKSAVAQQGTGRAREADGRLNNLLQKLRDPSSRNLGAFCKDDDDDDNDVTPKKDVSPGNLRGMFARLAPMRHKSIEEE